MPALFTAWWRAPKRSTVSATAASLSSLEVASSFRAMASPPASSISLATFVAASRSMSVTTTVEPSAASRRAIAAPIPEPAPVTSETSPLNLLFSAMVIAPP